MKIRNTLAAIVVLGCIVAGGFYDADIIQDPNYQGQKQLPVVLANEYRFLVTGDSAAIGASSGSYFTITCPEGSETLITPDLVKTKDEPKFEVTSKPLPPGWYRVKVYDNRDAINATVTSQTTVSLMVVKYGVADKILLSVMTWFFVLFLSFTLSWVIRYIHFGRDS